MTSDNFGIINNIVIFIAKMFVTNNIVIMQRDKKNNPFKFGTVVDEPYFTDRKEEIKKVRSILSSENHLIMISPRRYGKTSLVFQVIGKLNRPYIALDLQVITDADDLAGQLLKQIYRIYPFEKIKQFIAHFRIIPFISIHPVTNEVDVSFRSTSSTPVVLEDVFSLIGKLTSPRKRLIVIFDEFQNIKKIGRDLDHYLRSYMQHQKNLNYVFLGSQESLIREIFEKKDSPFYHFGFLFPLGKIPKEDFYTFLAERFTSVYKKPEDLADSILDVTGSHPYYTQQLAFTVWELLARDNQGEKVVDLAVEELIHYHDIDYERLWNTLNRTDMKLLIGMTFSDASPLSEKFSKQFDTGPSSTVYSSLKKLMGKGFVIKTETGYEIDDPFFKQWLWKQRMK